MRYLALALTMTACGSPFTARIAPADGGPADSEPFEDGGDETNSPVDARIHHDAAPDAHHKDAAGPPGEAGVDSGGPDVTGNDSTADTEPACDASASTYVIIIASGPRAGEEFSYPTPAACVCASISDCSCLQGISNICQGAGAPVPADCTATSGNRALITCTGP